MVSTATLGQGVLNLSLLVLIGAVVLLPLIGATVLLALRYRRCPPDSLLVVYGQGVPGGQRVLSSGAVLVWPLLQDSKLLSLKPLKVSLTADRLLSRSNDAVDIKATVVLAIGTDPARMKNAAERLLGYDERQIEGVARDILTGNLRMVVAMLEAQEMKSDPENFSSKAIREAEPELEKIGLQIISYTFDRVYQKP